MNHASAARSGVVAKLLGGFISGALGGVGLCLLAAHRFGFDPAGKLDVAFVLGALVGGMLGWKLKTSARLGFVVVGVALFVLRLLWLQPLLLAGVGLAGIVAAACARWLPPLPLPRDGRAHLAAAAAVATLATVVYSVFSVHRHLRFGSGSWDYGCYLHNAWLFAHGQAFSTSAVSAVLGDAAVWGGTNHFMPSLLFTAPLAWAMEASSSTSLLLVAQAMVVCASVLPLAAIAKRRGLPLLTTTALALAFVFHTGTQAALLFDVHEIAPVPLLLFGVLWIGEAQKPSLARIIALLALLLLLGGTKESALLYAAAVGALLLLRPGWRWVGAGVVVFFGGAFVVVVFFVQPALLEAGSKGMIHLARFGGEGAGGLLSMVLLHPGRTLATLISPDVKLLTIGTAGAGFGFLPFVSGEALVLALPNLAERFLADKREMWGLGFHYGLVGAAFLAWGALDTLTRVHKHFATHAGVDVGGAVLVLGALVSSLLTSPSAPDLATFDKPYYASSATVERYKRALAFVDANDAVVAQNHFLPHLALREHIWLPEQRFIDRADVVVLDTASSPWPHDPRHIARLTAGLQQHPSFAVAFHEGTTWVFRRRPST